MQQLRSFALPTPPTDIHDYGHLQEHLLKGIGPRFVAFFILAIAPLFGFLHPPTPMKPPLASSSSSSSSSSLPPPQSWPSSTTLHIFFVFNSLALISCIAGLLVSVSHYLSSQNLNRFASIAAQRKRLAEDLSKTAGGVACLVLVCVSLAAAYPFAGLTVAGESRTLQYAVVVPSLVGGYVLLEVLLFVIRHFVSWWSSFMPDHHLWRAIQEDTLFGSLLAKFLENLFRAGRKAGRYA